LGAGKRKGEGVSGTNDRFKKAKATRRTSSVKHVTLSDEAKKKYEDLVKTRDEQERAYGRHLAEERKAKR
jgi:ACT domain-containing protein